MIIFYHDSIRIYALLNIADNDFRILIDFGSPVFDLEEIASLNECRMSCQWEDSMLVKNKKYYQK